VRHQNAHCSEAARRAACHTAARTAGGCAAAGHRAPPARASPGPAPQIATASPGPTSPSSQPYQAVARMSPRNTAWSGWAGSGAVRCATCHGPPPLLLMKKAACCMHPLAKHRFLPSHLGGRRAP
jgi:hypothetical protein